MGVLFKKHFGPIRPIGLIGTLSLGVKGFTKKRRFVEPFQGS